MIELRDISVRLENRNVLDGLSVSFERGRLHCLIGPNGAGKTTLLKTSLGFIVPGSGCVLIDGRPAADLSPKERALKLSYLPQSRTLPGLTVKDLISRGRFPHRRGWAGESAEDRRAVQAAMERTDTAAFAERPLKSLSGGELQRVYIAMALAQQTDGLLLDEPTGMLDLRYQIDVIRLLKDLALEGRAVVIVLHDLQQAFSFADDVTLVAGGKAYPCSGAGKDEGLALMRSCLGASVAEDHDPLALYNAKLIK